MKRPRRLLKERIPRREGRPDNPPRNLESGVALSAGLAFVTLWTFGGQSPSKMADSFASLTPTASLVGTGTVLAILGLVLINAVLTAVETAVGSLRPAHIKLARDKYPRRAERLQQLFEVGDRIVAACAVATKLVMLLIGLGTFVLSPNLLHWLVGQFGWANSHANLIVSALILLIPVAFLHIVLSELIPKSYASANPIRVANLLYRPALMAGAVFGLPASGLTRARRYFTERFGDRAGEDAANLAEEEIKTLAEEGHETGEIEVGERELLHSVFEFTDTVAREVMTPRVDIDAMSVKGDPTEVARLIQESGHSRIPLYEGTDDQIVGIIHAKDLFGAMLNGKAPNLKTLMRPALFVPENKSLHELLAEMRQHRSQMAVVQDEFGGTAGIVTIEDIVEELVGDIIDEYDVEEPEIVEAPGGWLVDGKTHLDDLNEAAGLQLHSDEFDTLGGFVFGLFGRQPKMGETIEADDLWFTIAESDGRRILRVKVDRSPIAVGDSGEGAL